MKYNYGLEKKIRESGFNKTKFAKEIGTFGSALTLTIQGQMPQLKTALKIVKVLDCEVEDIFRVDGYKAGKDIFKDKVEFFDKEVAPITHLCLEEMIVRKGITKTKLAEDSELVNNTISKILGGNNPEIESVLKIVSVLGCRVKNVFVLEE